ncbi:MAG: CarD family transcriptional regulator, partial [Solirubrobacterales bacterium]
MKKAKAENFGESREYLTIKILHNEMTVEVPVETAAAIGLRRVIDEDEIKKVISVLSDEVSDMPKNWNRRFKYNKEKIRTGDVFELAEVVRNLALREMEKGLSTGEKQMYTQAKKILASEFMYALDKDEEGAEEYLDTLLEERFQATVAAGGSCCARGPGFGCGRALAGGWGDCVRRDRGRGCRCPSGG